MATRLTMDDGTPCCPHAHKRDSYQWWNSLGQDWYLCVRCLNKMEAAKARGEAFMKANPDYAMVPGIGTEE
jgi:Zn ribbon nucleic-acid-binding protein